MATIDAANTAPAAAGTVLPPETLSSHLSALELITAMWQGDDELELSDRDADAIRLVGEYLNLPLSELGSTTSHRLKDRLPSHIHMSLLIHPENGAEVQSDGWQRRKVKLDLDFVVRRPTAVASAIGQSYVHPRVTVRSPDWLSRDLFDRVCEAVKAVEAEREQQQQADEANDEGDAVGLVMDIVERVSQVVLDGLASQPPTTDAAQGAPSSSSAVAGANGAATPPSATAADVAASRRVLRTWSYLPSLSSREKRSDIVTYALSHSPPLTGFVLAGKPGLIVLEHPLPPLPPSPAAAASSPSTTTTTTSSSSPPAATATPDRAAVQQQLRDATVSLDTFWSRIKSQSWADIPSGHKKVSEKFREEDVERAFDTFEEMTERQEVGGKEVVAYGGKRNKSDLRSVQQWLDGKGLEGRMEKVLGAEWTSTA
ncbi:uncharacterized protein PFL1_00722 [Pseudozyma flocculosa PF-1]|uniref:YTH domain-containing protein n=1 Tax=Pseudozyma flocculosa TaxID=84751 RepID=A0A5C3F2T4_9BASI|nr:uncharacterized protein PFL1_00722 [Pseudozyma flocculosa PF-1]EPQ31387.1 hypothetical protein PFL1_00722 [Pseudozyma flocculosa PF-1]SPO38833.1 uncharacterized protein PSFLO_04312 [Pseudozyma flocculosa]